MSGFEIVGVILGALPLVISALEHYAQGVSTAKRFWQYKLELKSLLRQIKTENAIFINTCEALLTGIVRVDQMTLFLKNPGGQVWRDPKIEKKLEESEGDLPPHASCNPPGLILRNLAPLLVAIHAFQCRRVAKAGK